MRSLYAGFMLILPAFIFLNALNAQNPQTSADDKPFKQGIADKKAQRPDSEHNMDKMQPWQELFASLSDEEKTELKKLQEKNPEAFREALKQKMQSIRAKKQEENSKITELVKKYNEVQSSAEKNQLMRQIKELCEKQFDNRMEANRKSIEHVEQRLNELKKKYQERLSKKNEIMEQRIKDLTKDPSLEW